MCRTTTKRWPRSRGPMLIPSWPARWRRDGLIQRRQERPADCRLFVARIGVDIILCALIISEHSIGDGNEWRAGLARGIRGRDVGAGKRHLGDFLRRRGMERLE